jgi:RNA polymerase sigma-70 factor (ECF subfamily)
VENLAFVNDDLLARARGGDRVAFDAVMAPHRRELLLHCYRMLGGFKDAEDALQDSLVAAWQGLAQFDGRSTLRTWLYRVTTNHCLNAARSATRRVAKEWNVPGVTPPEPTSLGEVAWLEPMPDAHLPELRLERRETVSLAFVTALQLLPPRQIAVLLLRDVLEFPASEVAQMLDASLDSVNSLLKRARETLRVRQHHEVPPPPDSADERALVAKFVQAWEAADLDAVVSLLTDDVFMSMPPIACQYEGRGPVREFVRRLFEAGRRFILVPTRANGQPAFGAYLQAPDGTRVGVGLHTVRLAGTRVCELIRFEAHLLESFSLPAQLPREMAAK